MGVPDAFIGLWRRASLVAPGFRDDTTRVVWLQTGAWYADLRVPAASPCAEGRTALSELTDAELLALAKIEGFAGQLAIDGDLFSWRRDLDLQPPGPLPDEGRCRRDGEVLIEDGVHADYQEIWRRDPKSDGPWAAFGLQAPAERSGLLVIAGARMIEFLAGPTAPEGPSILEQAQTALLARDRPRAEALVDRRVRYAERDGGGWQVRLATQPWFEGRSMWSADAIGWDTAAGVLKTPDTTWRLLESGDAAEPVGAWIAGLADA